MLVANELQGFEGCRGSQQVVGQFLEALVDLPTLVHHIFVVLRHGS